MVCTEDLWLQNELSLVYAYIFSSFSLSCSDCSNFELFCTAPSSIVVVDLL